MSNTNKTKTTTKRAIAISIFNTNIATLNNEGARIFRKNVIASIMSQTDSTLASAAAMYNHAKKKMTKAGVVAHFGRAVKQNKIIKPVMLLLEYKPMLLLEHITTASTASTVSTVSTAIVWETVTKGTSTVTGTYATRRKAQAAKSTNEKVRKAA